MHHWVWLVSLVGILSTAVVCGTDMFFLTIGRPALRMASPSAGTEIMGFFHLFADATSGSDAPFRCIHSTSVPNCGSAPVNMVVTFPVLSVSAILLREIPNPDN